MACLVALALEASPSLSSSSHTNRGFAAHSSPSSKSPKSCLRIDSGRRHRPLKGLRTRRLVDVPLITVQASQKVEPLKVMISGAPASGKGTQCEFIKNKYGFVHISAGDLLRAEVSAGTENGKRAKEHMEKGMLAPDEIVVLMVKERLLQPDAQQNGWLLDGYPRSASQAKALEDLGIRPDIFILLDVNEETLVERVVGRRLDPVTGKIYHLKYSPPENEEIAARLTLRFDDTEERVKLRLQTHHQNVEAVLSLYKDLVFKVDGNAQKDKVFTEIDNALSALFKRKLETDSASTAAGLTY
ncbi:adenylate kinase, chloroplastic-like [Dioscorea cayenensis subsp. rotundata]|uniref:adenylate kinase n=1 Tax=Dioscorea cayennensis subsp. rotundata TaxID=55577 RepID=A0AB40B404_DIOCR|nr:adenylate kinase, chloroplastic-like [Dioscorea cayenensis subsp. rotundata]